MINRYYKTISPSLAKKRIAKLVEAKSEAFEQYRKAEKLGLKTTKEHYLTEAVGFSEALRVMGIVTADCLED